MATHEVIEGAPASDLAGSFGAASAVVIAGVLAAWIFVKQDAVVTDDALFERDAAVTAVAAGRTQPASSSLLEQAEVAFAAGRIIEPEFDNALNYYLTLLGAEPDNADAIDGVDRVISYLENQAEGAIFQNDWDAARAYAAVIMNVRPNDTHGRNLRERADRFERIEVLTARALDQFSRGRLVSPKDNNAAASYGAILELDPANAVAQQGLRSIVQRLIANAQSAAFAGDQARAKQFVADARTLDPNATGLAEVEKSTQQIKRAVDDNQQQNDLLAAAEALQADRLMPPATPNAYDLFRAVLVREPGSYSAQRGLALVQDALLDRAEATVSAGSLGQAAALLSQARSAQASAARIAAIEADLKYQQRLADAREGRFDRRYSMSELSVTRQVVPNYPRAATSRHLDGWVDVEFTVSETGDVANAKVLQSSMELFDGAALAAITRFRFEPVMLDGRPIPVRGVVKFSFKD